MTRAFHSFHWVSRKGWEKGTWKWQFAIRTKLWEERKCRPKSALQSLGLLSWRGIDWRNGRQHGNFLGASKLHHWVGTVCLITLAYWYWIGISEQSNDASLCRVDTNFHHLLDYSYDIGFGRCCHDNRKLSLKYRSQNWLQIKIGKPPIIWLKSVGKVSEKPFWTKPY